MSKPHGDYARSHLSSLAALHNEKLEHCSRQESPNMYRAISVIIFSQGPWETRARTGVLPAEFEWLFDGLKVYQDYEKVYCPPETRPKNYRGGDCNRCCAATCTHLRLLAQRLYTCPWKYSPSHIDLPFRFTCRLVLAAYLQKKTELWSRGSSGS